MIQIAQKIIEQKEGPFDPEQFNDRYEDALRALIKEKQKGKGRKVSAPDEPADTNVVDLMEALRNSLGKAPAKAAAKKPAAKAPAKAAHKAAPRKKAG
jgi:DNA end-binding protein Ku